MKKTLLFFMLFYLFFCCNTYSDDFLSDSGISELFPEPPVISEKPVKFEPDPDDPDRDGLSNEEEEKCGTDPYDPDTDNDGFTDLWEVTNGTDPTAPGTFGYLEVIDLKTGNEPVPASDENSDKTDEDNLFLPGYYDDTKPGDPDEYKKYVPPEPWVENDFPPYPWNDVTVLPEVIEDKVLENTDDYTNIIPPILENEESLSISKDKTKDSLNIDELNDLSDEENDQQSLLDNPSSSFDLTPIFMLLLLDEDSDSDGLLDTWEMEHFGSLEYGAEDDPDQDNLSNTDEYNNHTNPNNPDTDSDGLTDGFEVLNGLNPNDTDTDADGLTDGWEVTNGLDPKDPDMDNDGLTDGAEITAGTDPDDSDTDNDDLPDFWEVNSGTNPIVYDRDNDLDSDLYSNYVEYILETDPDNVSSSPIPGYHHKYDDKGRLIKTTSLKNYEIEYDIRYTYDMTGNRSTRMIR